MFVLWSFGKGVLSALSPGPFLSLYLLSALSTSVTHILYNRYMYPGSGPQGRNAAALGASGSVMAMTVVFAMMWPGTTIYHDLPDPTTTTTHLVSTAAPAPSTATLVAAADTVQRGETGSTHTGPSTATATAAGSKKGHDGATTSGGNKDDDGDESTYDDDAARREAMARMPWYGRKRVREFIGREAFHNTIIGLVIFDLVLVFIELIIAILSSCTPVLAEQELSEGSAADVIASGEPSTGDGVVAAVVNATAIATCTPTLTENPSLEFAKIFLFGVSVTILCIFTVEITVNIYAKGFRVWVKSIVTTIDAAIVISSLAMELGFKFSGLEDKQGGASGAIVVLRVWKIVRAMHAVAHSIEMRNQHVIHAIRNAMKSTNTLTAEIVTVYLAQRKEFFRLHSALLLATADPTADAASAARVPLIAAEMPSVFR
ncbi:hypothetical protein HDU93_008429, partial [Gonapodya sp. JEL0774]